MVIQGNISGAAKKKTFNTTQLQIILDFDH